MKIRTEERDPNRTNIRWPFIFVVLVFGLISIGLILARKGQEPISAPYPENQGSLVKTSTGEPAHVEASFSVKIQ